MKSKFIEHTLSILILSCVFVVAINAIQGKDSARVTARITSIAPYLEIESLDFGAMFGVGTDFSIAGLTWTLAARYDLGLKKIAKDTDAKNRAFSFLFGLSW